MSVKEKYLECFTTNDSTGDKAFLLTIEREAKAELEGRNPVFSTYISSADRSHFVKSVTVITNAGWKLSSIANGSGEDVIFAVFTRATPAELAWRETKISYHEGNAVFVRVLPNEDVDEFTRELTTIIDLEGELIGMANEKSGKSVFAVFQPYLHDNFG